MQLLILILKTNGYIILHLGGTLSGLADNTTYGMMAIPILWIWFEEDNEFENLDEYYNMKKEYDKNKDKCDN